MSWRVYIPSWLLYLALGAFLTEPVFGFSNTSKKQKKINIYIYKISSSLHDLPTKIDLPIKHHKTIILSYPFHVRAMSKLCAQAYTVQKLYTKSWKGSRFNNKTSDQIRWLPITSTDLSPDPSTFDTTSPRRSASLHPSIVANLVASEVKFFDGFVNAQGIGQGLEEMESRASRRWLMDDSWQNSKSQTWSNFWCLDISQVAWIKTLCVSKLPARWS